MSEDYQAVNLKELVMMILRKWWLLTSIMLITTIFAYWFSVTYTIPIYRAQATLFIGKDSNVLASINVSDLKFSNELVSDYRELLSSRLVTKEIIEALENRAYHEQIIRNMNVFTIEGTRFMYVSYDDPSPDEAAFVANKLSEVLIKQAEDIVGVQNIRIIDYAIGTNDPINADHILTAIIGAIIGILLAVIVIFIMMITDNTVKEEKFIEDVVELPILGKIPKFDGEVKKS